MGKIGQEMYFVAPHLFYFIPVKRETHRLEVRIRRHKIGWRNQVKMHETHRTYKKIQILLIKIFRIFVIEYNIFFIKVYP